ncbi:flippase [bacterium]|nr:flippase [bacterium]
MREIFNFKYWKNFSIGSPTKKRLTENFLSLSTLQVFNYLLPLITLPYLVRVLGPEKFGLIAFAQAFIWYFIILTDYGFNLSATREISINRENKEKIKEIFSSVMVVKFMLGALSFFILVLILIFVPKFKNDWLVYIFTFGMVIGQILFPVWFFQGMERMKYITILNIIAKGIFTICIFIFIRKMADYLYVPLIISMGFLVAGGLSLRIVSKDFGIKFILPSFEAIKYQLKEGWHIFISTAAISLYTTSNAFILGLFTNNTIVGYYSAAEKIVKAVQGLLTPVSQTVYPYFSKLYSIDKKRAAIILRKALYLIGSITFLISGVVSMFSPLISKIVLGPLFLESVPVLRILIFIVFAIGVNNILGIQGLVAFGHKEEFAKIVGFCSLFHLAIITILILQYSLIGVAIGTVITESLIGVIEYSVLKRKKIL